MSRPIATEARGGMRGADALPRRGWRRSRLVEACLLLAAVGLALGGCARTPATGPAAAGPAPAPPALNHVYVVLDGPTFAALRDSAQFRRALGPLDAGLPDHAPPGPDADRVFLRGRQTYLEFFGPDNRFHEPVGKVGIAMGFDDAAPLLRLERIWRRAYGDDIRRSAVAWRHSDPPVPWYDAVQRDATAGGAGLVLWAMAYRPEFVRWQSGDAARPSGATRAEALASRWRADQGFVEVTGLAVDVPAALHDAIVEQLMLAGMAATRTASGTRLDGDDWSLALGRADGEARGLEHLRLRTATAMQTAPALALGHSHLAHLTDRTALWRFGLQAQPATPGPATD
ncbi:DUF5829 family protein [Luteimonas sp. RD2P54]|uniref:DUF5829 family protein n=1 Tax=Luteimonas endophytica TaxID=3042023 RepID=A0ABT6J4E8_9GAMM|nr:DUF5829 family protein [Luteimonas endophytica]MDH5821695.1 DUF5829 family protein [Luteimonas endophytica]